MEPDVPMQIQNSGLYFLSNLPEFLKLYLVDGCAHRSLQDHLQHLCISRVLVGGEGQLLSLLLHVLYCHLDGCGYNLESDEETSCFSDQGAQRELDKTAPFYYNLISRIPPFHGWR